MTKPACPICASASRSWVELLSARLHRCVECNHCFTDSASLDQLEAYGTSYYLQTHRNWFENPNVPLFRELRRMILARGARNLLDVGCGNGAFLKYMRAEGAAVTLKGIDLSDAVKDENISVVSGDFLQHDFKEQFDVIVCLAVIEHLVDVRSFVRRQHELLAENGMAFIMTLNEDGILYRTARLLRRVGITSPFLRLYDPHHINHFSQASLIDLLTRDGLFEVVRVMNHDTVLSAIDIPARNALVRLWMKVGVAGIFMLGRLTGKTYLQTVVVGKKSRPETLPPRTRAPLTA